MFYLLAITLRLKNRWFTAVQHGFCLFLLQLYRDARIFGQELFYNSQVHIVQCECRYSQTEMKKAMRMTLMAL